MNHDQRRLDHCNKETEELNVKVRRLDARMQVFNQMISQAESNENMGFIKTRLVDLKRAKVADMAADKEKLMASIGVHEAEAQTFALQRDRYADWLIGHYGEKLTPLETKKAKLEDDLNNFNAENAPAERDFAEWAAKITRVEGQKSQNIRALAATGMSKKDIARDVAILDTQIKEMRKYMEGWDKIKQERAKIKQRIAKTNEKLVKMDERPQFINMKKRKPLIVTPREAPSITLENSTMPPVTPAASPDLGGLAGALNNSTETDLGNTGSNDLADQTVQSDLTNETAENSEGIRLKSAEFVDLWNAFLNEKFGTGANKELRVDPQELLQISQVPANNLIDQKKFREIMHNFYEIKNPGNQDAKTELHRDIEDFLKKIPKQQS